jgi:hypothetical protein
MLQVAGSTSEFYIYNLIFLMTNLRSCFHPCKLAIHTMHTLATQRLLLFQARLLLLNRKKATEKNVLTLADIRDVFVSPRDFSGSLFLRLPIYGQRLSFDFI